MPADKVNNYINGGLNVRKISKARKGALVYSIYHGNAHVGYLVERDKVLHATIDKGVKISPLVAMHPIAFFEVINESDTI